MKTLLLFWNTNKVFILGLLSAIGLSLNEMLTANTGDMNLKVYGFAALMAGLSFIANKWRGQGVTITGVVGILSAVFVQMHTTGVFTIPQFIIYSALAILAAVAPPPKPLTYEKDAAIVQAKEVPAADQVEIPPTVKTIP
jgi:urea transporter